MKKKAKLDPLAAMMFPPFTIEPDPFKKPQAGFSKRRKNPADPLKRLSDYAVMRRHGEEVVDLLALAEGGDLMAYMTLAATAEKILSGLFALSAHGHKPATVQWHNILAGSLKDLELLAWNYPERVRHIARKCSQFPGTISLWAEKNASNDALLNKIELGREYPIDHFSKGKKPEFFTGESNHLALRVWGYIEHFRTTTPLFHGFEAPPLICAAQKMEPLSAGTLKKWQALAWKFVVDAAEGHPEKNIHLRKMGAYATQKDGRRDARKAVAEEKSAQWIVNGIKTRLDNSLKLLAANLTKDS